MTDLLILFNHMKKAPSICQKINFKNFFYFFFIYLSLSRSINLIYQSSDYTNDLINKKDLTLVQLESQINASLGLKSAKEYKFWLLTLARYLTENNYEEKLANLCSSLLGPIYSTNWCDKILNLKKRDILKEILPIMAQNLELQRLYSSIKDQLNQVEEKINTKKSVLNKIMASENVPSRDTIKIENCSIEENDRTHVPME